MRSVTVAIPGYSGAPPAITVQIIVPPPLAEERSGDEWCDWVAGHMEGYIDSKGKLWEKPNKGTISDRLIRAHAPIWGQSRAIRAAIAGELNTPAARELREQFLNGASLSLLPPHSAEAFNTFVPVLQRVGENRYQAGLPPGPVATFESASPAEALDWGREEWAIAQRGAEIEAFLEKARDASRSLGALRRAVLTGRLKAHKELRAAPPNGGEPLVVVWENGAHNRYVVEGPDYCYGFEASTPVGAVAGAIAARGRGLSIPKPDDSDVPCVAPDNWRKGEGDWAYTWKGGGMRRNGAVEQNGTAVGALRWKDGKFTLLDARGKRLESLPRAEKPGELLLAWGASRLLQKSRR
jgi:hypothetical protein